MNMRIKLAWTFPSAIIFAIVLVHNTVAGPYEEALAAYGHGDYVTAIQLLRPLAEQGNAEAQYTLSTAQATEPTGMLMLACQGQRLMHASNLPAPPQKDSVSMGIIVNFTTRMIEGFDWTFPIDTVTEIAITFVHGHIEKKNIGGQIDRITGAVEASIWTPGLFGETLVEEYSLKCKPTQRMF
jgi:hypothetical protein